MSEVFVPIDDNRVRLSDADLHRRACRAFFEGDQIVFQSLPGIISQIIENKTWKAFGKKSFADYALDATSNGLGVNTNQRLWMLRCAMDVHGAHIKEWADVLAKVEEMVRLEATNDGVSLKSFKGNSLETIAKSRKLDLSNKITYLPSGAQRSIDSKLLRIKDRPDVFRRVAAGKTAIDDAVREVSGRSESNHLAQAKYYIKKLDEDQLAALLAWMREEGKV